ncbi:unnamed protein product [marine sediment metagenome]|uniref:PIN domain-containing protein n=1 Tax=marine sediment metagenome TaxID=412755 RepID=X1AEU4_9ZZZZ
MPKMSEIIVFDANFFICMNSIRAKNLLGNLDSVASDLGFEYYISTVVFDEIKAPHTFRENSRKSYMLRK